MSVLKYWIAPIIISISPISFADKLKPFVNDGCSAFPDGNLKQKVLWLTRCTAHDLAYGKGGTYDERIAAVQAINNTTKVKNFHSTTLSRSGATA